MKRYFVEFEELSMGLYVMAYSEQHVRDIFPDYNIVAIDQTDQKGKTMVYILIWMQLFSGQSVEHYQLGTYATLEECNIELSAAAKMVTHKAETVACLEVEVQR